MAKEKKIVKATSSGKSDGDIAIDAHGKIVKVEHKGEPKERATSKRIIAICLWLVGIFFEVIGILRLKGVIGWIPSLSATAFLIIVLVLDCIAVVVGSQFWKKSNHIDPASEKNALKFWVQNNLGTIISVIAFLPIILLVLTDKNMDKKNKTIVGIVAIVLFLIAGVSSYDWNPVSSEQLQRAEQEVLNVNPSGTVYWAPNSKKYHVDKDCPSFSRSETIIEGTVRDAFEAGLTDPCRRCIPELEEDNNHEEEAK